MVTSRRRTSTRRASTRRKTSTKKADVPNASQKKLKERAVAPWKRLARDGYRTPYIYQLPWENRSLSSMVSAKYYPGIGYVANYFNPTLRDYLPGHYTWESYIALRAQNNPVTPFPEGTQPENYTLRDDQREDVDTILDAYQEGAPQFLVGNGTGTGKTVTTIAALHKLQPRSVLIVCPAAVIPVWTRHIEHMGDKGIKFVVMNYESLKKMVKPPASAIAAKKVPTQNKKIALEGSPYAVFDMVVVDEAHKTKNPTAQQSRIVDMFISSARFSLLLTATPGKNPSQLGYLWRLLSYNTGDNISIASDKDLSRYITWCNQHKVFGVVSSQFGNGISFKGSHRDVEEMEKLIYSPAHSGIATAIKRVPGNWLPTVRSPYPIELSSKQQQDYQLEVETVKKILMGLTPTSTKEDRSKGVAAMMRLRQKTGMLKAPHLVEYVKYLLDDMEHQVVISTIFHNTADVLSELLAKAKVPHEVITGRDGKEDKELKRLRFQRGEVPVVITSVTTGISLHQNEEGVGGTDVPRTMVIADVHYSPIEQVQLEGRINRNGQNGVIVFPVLQGTADNSVVNNLLSGMSTQSILQSSGDEDDLVFLRNALCGAPE